MIKVWVKDPSSVLDWHFDWLDWLETGETIIASTMTADSGLTIAADSHTDTNTTSWLAGGTSGSQYTVTNRITTNQGRIDDRSITIRVMQR